MPEKSVIGLCMLLCVGSLFKTINASPCQTNQDVRHLIKTENAQTLDELRRAIDNIDTLNFALLGDNPSYPQDPRFCKSSILSMKEKQPSGNDTWKLECWRPSQCIIEDQTATTINAFTLLPDDLWRRFHRTARTFLNFLNLKTTISARTMVLPYNRNTVTYTFLPLFIGRMAAFFVTSLLSGCGFFVAKPDKICNLIVLHANVYDRDVERDGVDYNHLQALEVLKMVDPMNKQCWYRLSIRWAPYNHEPVINKTLEVYQYGREVQYYNNKNLHFLYAFNDGGLKDRWKFCIKTLSSEGVKECFYI